MADTLNLTLAPQFVVNITHEMGDGAGFNIIVGIATTAPAGGDMTASEIKIAYESNADTNEFSDLEEAKLGDIEDDATADQSGSEIKTLYELEADTNAFNDAAVSKLAGITAGADVSPTPLSNAQIKTQYELNLDTNVFDDLAEAKLGDIEADATADQTDGEIETAYNAQVAKISAGEITAGTEVTVRRVSPADLKAIVLAHETGGGGMSDSEVKAAYENNANTNEFDDAEQSKLAAIEALADVTDAGNVAAAGAIMDSDISAGEGHLRKTGSGAYVAMKTNLGASAAPGASNDNTQGYAVGSQWIDTTADKEYVCLDIATGAAVWTETTGAGGGGMSDAEVKTAYENNADTNVFDDAAQTKLGGIDPLAKAEANLVNPVIGGKLAWLTDVFLERDGAGILAQRNGTTPQTFRIYNTYSDGGTNFERGAISWAGNAFRIGTNDGGTGVNRVVSLIMGGLVGLTLDTSKRVLIGSGQSDALGGIGSMSIATGDSGVTNINSSADDLVIEGAGDTGITVATPSANIGSIKFADPDLNNPGMIRYVHTDNSMDFATNGSIRWRISSGGHFLAVTDNVFDVGSTGALRPRHMFLAGTLNLQNSSANKETIVITGFSITGANAQNTIDIAGTWNTTGAPTLIYADVLDTASDAAAALIDLKVGGVSMFKVTKAGLVTAVSGLGSMSDAEVETAYSNIVGQISAGEITAGTETALRTHSPADVKAMVDEHGGGGNTPTDINFKSATNYTLVLTDAYKIIEMSSTASRVLTIPSNASEAFDIGTLINVTKVLTGDVTITAAAGVALNGITAGSGLLTDEVYSGVALYKRATDAWVVQGAIAVVA